MADINRHYRPVKRVLKRDNLSGSFLASKYRFSPYAACEHGCLYCDGRAERYYIEGQFERDIVIRSNVPDLLQQELPKQRERGIISIGSGVSDAYQPVEKSEKLMQRCAEVLADYRHGIIILTKSALILRDLDYWTKIHQKSGFLLAVSLTYPDDRLRSLFEPRAATVEQRIEVLEVFKKAGCFVGVLAMPFLPLIGDHQSDVYKLYEKLAQIPVDFIMPSSLTLRPGRQKDTFLRLIQQSFPEQLEDMRALYREERPSGAPVKQYQDMLFARITEIQKDFAIPFLVPHVFYQNKVHLYDEVNILLHHMVEIYAAKGIDVRPLNQALSRYMAWIVERKKIYNRRPSLQYAQLEQEFVESVRRGHMKTILKNEKLSDFFSQICLERRVFDYSSAKTL